MSELITNIEIKNFKSIRHQKIEGCKRITLFIGYPNVGKSNILEALSGFSILAKSNMPPLNELVRFQKPIDIFFNANSSENVEISIDDKLFLNYQYSSSTTLEITIANHSKEDENALQNVEVVSYFKSFFREKGYQIPDGFTTMGDILQIKPYKYQSLSTYYPAKDNSLLVPFGNNLQDIIETYLPFKKEVIKLFDKHNLKLLFDKSENEHKILKFLDDESYISIPMSLMADTLHRLILYKAAIASNDNTVLLLEEPESHMFPPYISKFTSDIVHDANNNQFFIATHSPYVLNDLMENAREDLAIYLVDYKNGETLIHKMGDEDIHDAYQFGYDFFMNIKNFMPTSVNEKV